MHFEGAIAQPPGRCCEIRDRRPEDWSPLLLKTWGEVIDDPADGPRLPKPPAPT